MGTYWSRSDIKSFFEKCRQDRIFQIADALTYSALSSLVPMLAMAYFVFSIVGAIDTLHQEFEFFVSENLAPAFGSKVSKYFEAIQSDLSMDVLGFGGLVGFLWITSSALQKVEMTFFQIFGKAQTQPWFRRLPKYMAILLLGPIVLGFSLWISANAMRWLGLGAGEFGQGARLLGGVLLPYGLSCALLYILYYHFTSALAHRTSAIAGALVVGLILEVLKHSYGLYATFSLKIGIYGVLTLLPVFMVWVQILSTVILLGFEFCCFLDCKQLMVKFSDRAVRDIFLGLELLEVFEENGPSNGSMSVAELARRLDISVGDAFWATEQLQKAGLIQERPHRRLPYKSYGLRLPLGADQTQVLVGFVNQSCFRPKGPRTRRLMDRLKVGLGAWIGAKGGVQVNPRV